MKRRTVVGHCRTVLVTTRRRDRPTDGSPLRVWDGLSDYGHRPTDQVSDGLASERPKSLASLISLTNHEGRQDRMNDTTLPPELRREAALERRRRAKTLVDKAARALNDGVPLAHAMGDAAMAELRAADAELAAIDEEEPRRRPTGGGTGGAAGDAPATATTKTTAPTGSITAAAVEALARSDEAGEAA